VEQLTSPEGHAFTYLSVPEANKISVQIAWPTDWNMRAETNKAVPFIGAELMLSGGAGDMDASALLEGFSDTNSEGHIVPTADYVRGILTIDKDHRDKAVAIANAVLTKPRLDENWLGRIAGNLEDRYAQASAQPSQMGWQAVRSAILGTSPVQQALSMLDKQTVEAVTRDDVKAWREQTFITAGATIVVTGPVTADEAGKLLDTLLAGLPDGKAPAKPDIAADFTPRTILLHAPDAKKTTIGFVGRLPPTSEGNEFEDLAALTVLGGGEGSRLFSAMRSSLRASYAFSAGVANYTRDIRLLVMTGDVDPDKLEDARKTALDTYAHFLSDGVTQAELDSVLGGFEKNLPDSADSVRLGQIILESVLDGKDLQRPLMMKQEIEVVDRDSIAARISSAFPKPEELIQIIVSSDADAVPGACVIENPEDAIDCK